ncbi:MAG: glycosyltransferase family 4 protein [Cyclobacteriaceae bacterium]|nr:glycosyltransferase family 4 protein [Cyclobacteriaceae bacterium]
MNSALLLIDASNILAGGGKTHLVELMKHAEPDTHGFDKVIVYGHEGVMKEIPPKPWLEKVTPALFAHGYLGRWLWKVVARKSVQNGIWFVPGTGSAPGNYVTMCQNLLPLDREERNRYFFSLTWLRLTLLSMLHPRAFAKAKGVIFLNEYCYNALPKAEQHLIRSKSIIPHGVSESFFTQRIAQETNKTLKLIYVSTVAVYKHQWCIAQAIEELRQEDIDVEIDFIGTAYSHALKQLSPFLNKNIRYHGPVDYKQLPEWYSKADAFIFGSTCETFGMVLLEAMAGGLPVLCSKYSSMSETLGNHAFYFDPLNVNDIKRIILHSYREREALVELAISGQKYAREFRWERTAQQTFDFLEECYKK